MVLKHEAKTRYPFKMTVLGAKLLINGHYGASVIDHHLHLGRRLGQLSKIL